MRRVYARSQQIGGCGLVDANGDRWDFEHDSMNYQWNGLTVGPGTRARTTLTFQCRSGPCESDVVSIIDHDGTVGLRNVRLD